jgi:adenylate cyclase
MGRRLAAVLNADVVGYSRLMSTDEAGTLRPLKAYETVVIEPTVAKHKGRIVKRIGDGYLAEFASVVDAVECALAWQGQGAAEGDRQLRFRMGVHLGDIIAEGEDIYGEGVNIAARLEALSQPGCITLSDDAFRQVRDRVNAEFHDLGEHEVKNIPRPLRVWEWRCPTAVPRRLQSIKLPALDRPSIVIMPFRNLTWSISPTVCVWISRMHWSRSRACSYLHRAAPMLSAEHLRRMPPARSALNMPWRAA